MRSRTGHDCHRGISVRCVKSAFGLFVASPVPVNLRSGVASAGEVVREGQCRRAAAWACWVLPVVSGSRIAGLGRPLCPCCASCSRTLFPSHAFAGALFVCCTKCFRAVTWTRKRREKPESFVQTRKSSHHRAKSGGGVLAGKGA